MFRNPSLPILLNRRTKRTSADVDLEESRRRSFNAFVAMVFIDLAIIAATVAITHSWLPHVQ